MVTSNDAFVAIVGGASFGAKVSFIYELIEREVDSLLIGGALAYTFLKAQGFTIGKSLFERDMRQTALDIIERAEAAGVDLRLPTDHQVVDSYEPIKGNKILAKTIPIEFTNAGHAGMDIGVETIAYFSNALHNARRIIWRGSMGVIEEPPFDLGTLSIARGVAQAIEMGATIELEGKTSRQFLTNIGFPNRLV